MRKTGSLSQEVVMENQMLKCELHVSSVAEKELKIQAGENMMNSKSFNKPNGNIRVVAVEGLDGVGRSELVWAYCKCHPEVRSVESEPAVYSVDLYLMTDAKFRASPTGRMLMDVGNVAAGYRGRAHWPILTDQSIWSAVAEYYAKAPRSLRALLDAVEALRADHVVLPDRVVVLKGSYETYQDRIRGKAPDTAHNINSRMAFERKYRMFDALKKRGYDMRFISTDGKSPAEVLAEFEALSVWGKEG